jgi:hypothetical protein
MTVTLREVQSFIQNATRDQLNDVVYSIKAARKAFTKRALMTFDVGSKVKFTRKSGMELSGVIVSVMRTRAVVRTPIGNWRVPASMLSAA